MDIFALLCVLYILFGIQYPQKNCPFFYDGLEKERTNALKGIAALLIILGHLGLTVQQGVFLPVLKQSGMFVVTIFFALSGYGLVLSYKKSGYKLNGYWEKRVMTVFIPYALFTVLYIFVRAYLGESISIKTIVLSFVNGSPLVRYSWFVEVIILLYAAFWLSAKMAKDDVSFMCFLMLVFCVVFCLGLKKLGMETFWYNTLLAFQIGMIWAHKNVEIAEALNRHFLLYLVGGLFVLAVVVYCTRILWWWSDLGEILVTSVFVVVVFMLQYLIPARSNPITKFFGEISFEMYMSHGAFIMLLWPIQFFKENPLLFCLAVYVGSILTAWVIHMLLMQIHTLIKRGANR